jgi:flagellar hook-associated protein 1
LLVGGEQGAYAFLKGSEKMASTFHGLEVAKSGLYAQRTALSTTGHNLANASTKGYSRQQVVLSSSNSITTQARNQTLNMHELGTGVNVEGIERVRDAFLDNQYRDEAQLSGQWQAKQQALEKLELSFNEPSDQGLRSVMDQFWNSWQDLSNEPDNHTARAVVKQRALAVIDTAKQIDESMSQLTGGLEDNVSKLTAKANDLLKEINTLNQEIIHLGPQANDLRDKRDLAVDKLAEMVDLNVKQESNYGLTITLANGETLLNKDGATLLGEEEGQLSIDNVQGGSIYGTKEAIEIVKGYQSELNVMMEGFVSGEIEIEIPAGSVLATGEVITEPTKKTVNGINGLHELGWTLSEDASGNAKKGEPFFLYDQTSSFSVQSLQLNPTIAKDHGMEEVNGQQKVLKGNGDLALAIGQLRDTSFTYNGQQKSGTLENYYRSMVGELGVEAQSANRHLNTQETILLSIDNQRQSVSGVSLDEEMANLIKFQHAYNAAAKMVSVEDQLLDTIINRMAAR